MPEGAVYLEGVVRAYSSVAQASGFWSVWMTALFQAFHDRSLLRRMLVEVTDREHRVITGYQTHPDGGTPPWTIFTGTAVDQLSI